MSRWIKRASVLLATETATSGRVKRGHHETASLDSHQTPSKVVREADASMAVDIG